MRRSALYRFAPHSLGWFVPLLLGMLLSIPMVRITSSLKLGAALARDRLFLIPSETGSHSGAEARPSIAGAARRRLPEDLRLSRIGAGRSGGAGPASEICCRKYRHRNPNPAPQLPLLAEAARRRDTSAFTRQDWVALLSDPESLRRQPRRRRFGN